MADQTSAKGQWFQSTLPVKGATRAVWYLSRVNRFQSTLPVKGATEGASTPSYTAKVSIHAPGEGSDLGNMPSPEASGRFNPRSR